MHATVDSALDPRTEALAGEWLSLREAAERARGSSPTGSSSSSASASSCGAPRRRPHGARGLHQNGQVIKGLPGTLTLLSDAGYDDEETIRWLFTADDTLPGTPVQALSENRGTEVRRRAQALAF